MFFKKKLKKFFRDPLKQKSRLSENGKAAQYLRIYNMKKAAHTQAGNKQPKLYLDVNNFEFLLFCTDYLYQHLINGIGIFSLLHTEVFESNQGFYNLRPFLIGQVDMIFLFFHCLTPPDTFIILIQVQKFKDAIILMYR